jgi:hypothetical protein
MVPFTSKESDDYYKHINQSDPDRCSTLKSHPLGIGFEIFREGFHG